MLVVRRLIAFWLIAVVGRFVMKASERARLQLRRIVSLDVKIFARTTSCRFLFQMDQFPAHQYRHRQDRQPATGVSE